MSRRPDGPAPRIYTSQPLAAGQLVSLEAGASRHVASALRLGQGDAVTLFNGSGGEYAAEIERVQRRTVEILVHAHRQVERESRLPVSLGLAISRSDRMDYAIQKSTELGVVAVYPLTTERTGVRLAAERQEKKVRHWQEVAISACEQCGRNLVPPVHSPQSLSRWLESTPDVGPDGRRLLLHPGAAQGLDTIGKPSSLSLLVGPEGGFSRAEFGAATAAGFLPFRLGPRVLRTETAPVAALAVVQFFWGDLR